MDKVINTTNALSASTQQQILDAVRIELLKRGFTARLGISTQTLRGGEMYLSIASEPFNTVPVIMQEITIQASLYLSKHESPNLIRVGGRVGVEYDHFTGGSNGTELFSISIVIARDDDRIFGTQIA